MYIKTSDIHMDYTRFHILQKSLKSRNKSQNPSWQQVEWSVNCPEDEGLQTNSLYLHCLYQD